jgi:C4-dicarboxylate-specific signal transduction histidine kinase
VIRTQESVILDDASTQNLFSQDEYVRQRCPRSALCLPLVKQVTLVGILYLENSLAPRVFTPKRLAMLELLASQAAISLDHARVYDELRQENSDRRKAEEALQKAQTELAHVTRVTTMGELAASIAHEVNQPLGAISNNVNACLRLLANGSENLREVESALSDIVKGVDRVNGIVVRMRALAKKDPPEMARLHLEDVVADVLTLTHHELTRRHVAIHSELPKDLPPILGDRIQLQQVLLNLVMNGVEAMNEVAEGERKIAIRARRHEHSGRPAVLVSVQDSGVGLKPAEVDRLFEAFYTTKAHGIGMGLAISRSIVEAHGGRLWVAPAGGPGATFEFILPAKS